MRGAAALELYASIKWAICPFSSSAALTSWHAYFCAVLIHPGPCSQGESPFKGKSLKLAGSCSTWLPKRDAVSAGSVRTRTIREPHCRAMVQDTF